MSEKSVKFGDKKINRKSFYKNKKVFKIEHIDISKILVSKKETYSEKSLKYFFGYSDDDVIRPLCVRPPKMIKYVKHFENGSTTNKIMSFKVTNNKLLKKYNEIWKKIVV